MLRLLSTSGSTAASNNAVWSSILPADFFFFLERGWKLFSDLDLSLRHSGVALPRDDLLSPPPLRGWPIMGEIDNSVAHRCWIYDNVRQRSSMIWIRLCCFRSCLALVSSQPTLVGSLSKLDFQKHDQFPLIQLLETLRVCTGIPPLVLYLPIMLFFLLFFSPDTTEDNSEIGSGPQQGQKSTSLQPGNNLCLVKLNNVERWRGSGLLQSIRPSFMSSIHPSGRWTWWNLAIETAGCEFCSTIYLLVHWNFWMCPFNYKAGQWKWLLFSCSLH